MSFAPIPEWQGLPTTPRRSVSEDSQVLDVDGVSASSRTTSTEASVQNITKPNSETRQALYSESMTPVRNWAAEIAEGAFQFESPSKFVQLPIESQVATSTIRRVTVEDEIDDCSENNDVSEDDEMDQSQYNFSEDSLSAPRAIPQINRLRESPIVITSSPPEQPTRIHYQWKTTAEPAFPELEPEVSTLESEPGMLLESEQDILSDSDPEISMSRCRISSSRQSSPARSILNGLGDDVIDISSLSPLAAKRAANILLQSPYYSKVTFNDEEGQKIWQDAQSQAGECELSELKDEESDDEMEDEESEEKLEVELPTAIRPSRISHGEWTKLDWKRLEKCLDSTDGEINEAIDLFLGRYIGRKWEEVEMRCRAVVLTRRRRALEGRKVEFILSAGE
jgi:hypothetical protein